MNKGSGTLRGSLAALAGRGARWNLAEMATESVMVVFAVLIALGVEEWREERQLRQFAAVARAAVELEIEENLDEFTATEEALRSLTVLVGEVIRADNESDAVFDEFEFPPMRLPDTSSAAWSAAQASEAAPYFDYGWIIRVAQAYDILDAYERLRDQFLDSMSFAAVKISSGMHPLEVEEELFQLYGRLSLVGSAHVAVKQKMDELLAAEEASPAPE